jgi:hypothetical protein
MAEATPCVLGVLSSAKLLNDMASAAMAATAHNRSLIGGAYALGIKARDARAAISPFKAYDAA